MTNPISKRVTEKLSPTKILLTVFAVLLAICFAAVPCAASAFSGGSGTAASPYLISTSSDLVQLANDVNVGNSYSGKYFRVENDINLASVAWTPIGTESSTPFNGTFNGSGFTITGLTIYAQYDDYQGLFGYIGDADIRNVNLTGVNITSSSYVGSLIGYASGSVIIENCHATGNVTGSSWYVGGLIGYASGSVIIENCHATGDVTGYNDAGGLIGYVDSSSATIKNCYATGRITGWTAGGLVGDADVNGSAVIENCYATGSVTGSWSIGGLIGRVYVDKGSATLKNCYATGNIYSEIYAGGLAGRADSGHGSVTIENCYATGSVIAEGGESVYAGGLIGGDYASYSVSSIIIKNCHATGSATADGSNYASAGGLIGNVWACNSGSVTIDNCYATGSATSNKYAGGLAGYAKTEGYVKIKNCYAKGSVTSDNAGGLIGYAIIKDSCDVTINTSVALNPTIAASNKSGRIMGYKEGSGTVTFTDTYAISTMSSGGAIDGINVSPTVAKTQSFYTGLEWDFTNVWKMDTNISQYPVFIWQNKEVIPVTPVTNTTASVNAATPAKIGYELSPSLLDTVQPPTFTHGANTIILNESVVVKKYINGVPTDVPATVNSDGTVQVNEDIDDADYITVTFVGRKIGDASGDGDVSVRDSVVISRYLAVLDPLDTTGQFYANLDGRSNGVKVIDCIKIARYKAGILDSNFEVM